MATIGRKPHEPTAERREKVKTLTAMGTGDCDVARALEISLPTLRKYYTRELETGSIEANAEVAFSLFQIATHKTRPSATACIFWLKARAGWCEGDLSGMGKKELADVMARASGGSEWDKLLAPKTDNA